MTRINCIPVKDLHSKHLLAEYRELPRVFTLAYKAHDKGFKQTINSYVLGTGHVKFFYDKLGYLANRHDELCDELELRGFTIGLRGFYFPIASFGKYELWNDWEPTQEAIRLNTNRINERLKTMK